MYFLIKIKLFLHYWTTSILKMKLACVWNRNKILLQKLGKFVSNDCYCFRECATPALKRIMYLKKASRLFSQILVCLMSILYILNNTRNIFIFGALTPLSAIFQLYHGIKGEPPTMSKQLANFITCDCVSSAPFCISWPSI